jgi:acyl-CoA synthetase (AMP-forming)/AMP-acid ligase II
MKNTSLHRPTSSAERNKTQSSEASADEPFKPESDGISSGFSNSHSEFRARLRERLFGRAYPLWVDSGGVLPAASLWFLVRERIDRLRQAGAIRGDRIVLSLSSDREALAWTLAALWEGCPAALAAPASPEIALETARYLSARALVRDDSEDRSRLDIMSDALSPAAPVAPHSDYFSPCFSLPPHSSADSAPALFLSTSGTSGAPRWVALSARNILSVLDSHLPALGLDGDFSMRLDFSAHSNFSTSSAGANADYSAARVLSILPLRHAFGLVIDALAALFAGAEIVRAPSGGRDVKEILALAAAHNATHCSMTPLTASRLAESEEGRNFLRALAGGVVGGAPVRGALAEFLKETRLRVGYGQTEASPGIMLGKPGVWTEGYIGEPLGCETRVRQSGELEFRGDNACVGVWTDKGFLPLEAGRWAATGDIVRRSEREDCPGFVYVGRVNEYFKLANGRWIPAPEWERAARERIGEIAEIVLYPSADNERCNCAVVLRSAAETQARAEETALFLRSEIARVLPLPAKYWGTVRILAPDDWRLTPKGDADRRALVTELRRSGEEREDFTNPSTNPPARQRR